MTTGVPLSFLAGYLIDHKLIRLAQLLTLDTELLNNIELKQESLKPYDCLFKNLGS